MTVLVDIDLAPPCLWTDMSLEDVAGMTMLPPESVTTDVALLHLLPTLTAMFLDRVATNLLCLWSIH